MNNHSSETLKDLLASVDSLTHSERTIIRRFLERKHITRNINTEFDQGLTFGQRLADRVAAFGGSWTFISIFIAIIIVWVILNTVILIKFNRTFDPYPFILLNLVLSMTAAIQAPVIMMAQNRQSSKDRLDAAHDYEVNLKAEMEISSLNEKMDQLRGNQWVELVSMQQEQIRLLTRLLEEKQGG